MLCCQSKYEHSQQNMLICLLNSLTESIGRKVKLPKFIVVILDDDIIKFSHYNGIGISSILGKYLEFLINKMGQLIEARKALLPKKAVKEKHPVIYWVSAARHHNFENDEDMTEVQSVFGIHSQAPQQHTYSKTKGNLVAE